MGPWGPLGPSGDHRVTAIVVKGPNNPSPPLLHRPRLPQPLPLSLCSSQLASGSSSNMPTKHTSASGPLHTLLPPPGKFNSCHLVKSFPTPQVTLSVHETYTPVKFKAVTFHRPPTLLLPLILCNWFFRSIYHLLKYCLFIICLSQVECQLHLRVAPKQARRLMHVY